MGNHTVGEWVYKKTSTGIRQIFGASGEKKVIADVSGLEDGIDNVARNIEANANAQLMAAAPDLLEACKATYNEVKLLKTRKLDVLPIVEKAITKATQATLQPR